MTTIKYRINNQTARTIIADDFDSAQTLRQQTIDEELSQLGWYTIIAEITNEDGSITMCPIEEDGTPILPVDQYILEQTKDSNV